MVYLSYDFKLTLFGIASTIQEDFFVLFIVCFDVYLHARNRARRVLKLGKKEDDLTYLACLVFLSRQGEPYFIW